MTRHRWATLLAPLLVLVLAGPAWAKPKARAQVQAEGLGPQLLSAVSRKTHGGTNFDIPLPLSGASAIECRLADNASGGIRLVLMFDRPVDSGMAVVTEGAATVNGAPVFLGNTMTVLLSDVANAQRITVTAANVASGGGDPGGAIVTIRTLLGDVDSNGTVTNADATRVSQRIGFGVDAATFRGDINFNGSFSATDVNYVNAALGTTVAGGATQNAAPTISDIPDQSGESGASTPAIAFAIGDNESAASGLGVSASSNNTALIPANAVTFGGSGATRTLTLTPAAGQTGTATVTVTVSDGLVSASDTFVMTVVAPTKLFITSMRPQGGALSQGTGTSTLRLAGDERTASVRFSFGNLTSPKIAAHVHGPADPGVDGNAGILFDLDVDQQEDGSFLWTFPEDATARAEMVDWIKTGRTYINVHSSNYPAGEIKGFYSLANGSIDFKPPPPPPPLPTTPPTKREAVRFLIQSTYGATEASMLEVMQTGYDGWITAQMSKPPTLMKPILDARMTAGEVLSSTSVYEGWWRISCSGEDQLRQRVAFALSQIFVVSTNHGTLNGQPRGMANYYDLLLRNAFGNFRTLLNEVTLNPVMGVYLDMRGSQKANTTTGRIPNENYPREILQLFSIGLNKLHPDGTLKLNQFGLPIATYDQNVVIGFARAFTGWDWYYVGTTPPSPLPANYIDPMKLIATRHETGAMPGQTYSKLLLDGVTLPTGRTGQQDLNDSLNNIFNHPNVGPFISRQLIQRLVTSTPSPGYVYRVARVFDGFRTGDENLPSAPRGDLGAVVRAILLDYEARSATFLKTPGYGKLREPLLRNTAVIRAFNPTSTSGQWKIGSTQAELLQTPLRPDTVFNFFEPDYASPGPIAAAGLVSPEFQITSETTAITAANFMRDGIYNGWKSGSRDIKINPKYEQEIATDPESLVDRVALLLMGSTLPPEMKTIIVQQVRNTPLGDTLQRARVAIHLVATSPHFCAQK